MWGIGSRRPTASEAAIRAYALRFVVISALAFPPRVFFDETLASWPETERKAFLLELENDRRERWRKFGRWRSRFSPAERAFADAAPLELTAQQLVNASWRLEAFQVVLWALGVVGSLPPFDTMADPELLKAYPPSDNVESFFKNARFRDRAEIDHGRDVAELWHWRSRTRELIEAGRPLDPKLGFESHDQIVRSVADKTRGTGDIGPITDQDFTVFGSSYRDMSDDHWATVRSITAERHFTLNWLCGYAPGNRWDETPTDT